MAKKDARTIQAELAKPFAPEDLEWRLQKADENGKWGIAVPYVTNRAIQARLDEVVGPDCWYNDFKPWHGDGKKSAQICGISIYFEERGGFITKWDGAEDSDIEPVKGGLSDSMKRAAVQWGIGRSLYNMDTVFVDVEKQGRSWVIKKGERGKLDKAYLDMLKKLGQQPASPTGTQSELTAGSTESAGGGSPSATTPPPAKTAGKQQPGPACDCIVRTAVRQKGMNSVNTTVVLDYPNGKSIQAYAQGEHPALVPGAMLSGVKVAQKKQDTVIFYILEAYQVIGTRNLAA